MNTTKTSATDSDGMLDAQVQGAMLLSIEPVEPASDRADALRDRVMAIARPAAPEPQEAIGADTHVTIRADEGEWVQRSPGVEMKILHDTPGSRSVLFRIAPGGTIPAHGHGGEEVFDQAFRFAF